MQELEQTLDSREVAEMIEKEHGKLLRDLRRYEEQFTEAKIGFSDFFRNSEYKDCTGRMLPCYRITKKGCEFIAHKLTGTKGTAFTARYINRFHEMQDMITQAAEQESELPWFIKRLNGEYVVLERDFIQLIGVEIRNYKGFCGKLKGGLDYNGMGWKPDVNDELFMQKYGFEFGDELCLSYFYLNGVQKAYDILANDRTIHMNPESYKILTDGINQIRKLKKKGLEVQAADKIAPAVIKAANLPKQISINIMLGDKSEIEMI